MSEEIEQRTLLDETMLADPDKWYRVYEELPEGERYGWIMETLDRTPSPDFFEHVSFAECIFELADRKEPAKYVALIRKLRDHPDFYKKEFQFFEHELAAYYLSLDEVEKAAESLRYYMENPVQGIDQLIQLVQLLVYYGKTDLAVECARQTYEEIEASPELIGGAGAPFAEIMFMWHFQQAYTRLKNGQEADWPTLQEELKRYNFVTDGEVFARNCDRVSRPESEIRLSDYPIGSENSTGLFDSDNMWKFVKYMLDRKQLDFPQSEMIWSGAFEFLRQRKGRKRPDLAWENWFAFSERELEAWLAKMVGGFLSTQQAEAFALLWGIPYVYDFLLDRGVISEKLHMGALRQVARLKTKMRNAYKDELWKYAFVDRWPALDHVDRELMQPEVYEDDDLDLSYYEDDDDDLDFDDDDDEDDARLFNPFFGAPLEEQRRTVSLKEKQKKKRARKEAKKKRKKNRK